MSKSIITYIFLFITVLNNAVLAFANSDKDNNSLKILTSSPTIAVVAGMVADDDFTIDTINIEGGCPHHYTGRPSDRKKLEEADAVIYIDDQFEGFFASLIRNFQGKKHQIGSNIQVINFANTETENTQKINWHFWNNPQKTYLAIEGIAKFMIQLKPDSRDQISARVFDIKRKLQKLEQDIKQTVGGLGSVILFSDNIEPLFYGLNYQKILPGSNPSLKFIQELEKIIEKQSDICIISDLHDQHESILAKYDIKHVIIDGESIKWSNDKNQIQQYIDYINNILNAINASY